MIFEREETDIKGELGILSGPNSTENKMKSKNQDKLKILITWAAVILLAGSSSSILRTKSLASYNIFKNYSKEGLLSQDTKKQNISSLCFN